MSKYSKRDLRAVNLLSLILVAIGGFLVLSTAISHADNQGSNASESAAGKDIPMKSKAPSMPNGFFVKRYILGSVFALCGVALHFGLKQNSQASDASLKPGDGE